MFKYLCVQVINNSILLKNNNGYLICIIFKELCEKKFYDLN